MGLKKNNKFVVYQLYNKRRKHSVSLALHVYHCNTPHNSEIKKNIGLYIIEMLNYEHIKWKGNKREYSPGIICLSRSVIFAMDPDPTLLTLFINAIVGSESKILKIQTNPK